MASTTGQDLGRTDNSTELPATSPQSTGEQRPQPLQHLGRYAKLKTQFFTRCRQVHKRIPYVRAMPLPAILIILLLICINLAVWIICGVVLASRYNHLVSTAALAYSLGLRHALDADHISAIDLMTRRLIATGQRPVTVGTFFSLGHSTVVVLTSIVVAATAAGVSSKFDSFSNVGGIIGSSVSAAFLIALGFMNAYILYKLVVQLKKVISLQPEEEATEAWKIEGGGVLFRVLKKMFKLIDQPWKMYPLGFLFGLGFDTSSEVALLGISSIQGAKGTSMWLILIFPTLFTVGMCLIDTIDGALMSSLYLAPMNAVDTKDNRPDDVEVTELEFEDEENRVLTQQQMPVTPHVRSPLTFLYYSIVLTALTVVVAIIIGVIQLLSLLLNVAVSEETAENSKFWQGVQAAGDYYDVIGGAICGSFIIVGVISVFCYRPWRKWVDQERARLRVESHEGNRGVVELLGDERTRDSALSSEVATHDLRPQDSAVEENARRSAQQEESKKGGQIDVKASDLGEGSNRR
ncbi:hypothetical protein H2198_007368 [Neophaeococcomyces mojaviensis]|uniref:Uncharacterized protein n=1 Tax=Neophaeococcomyces mojaviensis TaxID=3383035 RepID=A0ACC3A0F1_9EURO|nr:hypothetical protein H2198_007368 [Knufia sp. JES_112]